MVDKNLVVYAAVLSCTHAEHRMMVICTPASVPLPLDFHAVRFPPLAHRPCSVVDPHPASRRSRFSRSKGGTASKSGESCRQREPAKAVENTRNGAAGFTDFENFTMRVLRRAGKWRQGTIRCASYQGAPSRTCHTARVACST